MGTVKQNASLDGRTAVITGGGGHLGRAMAAGLASQGADICLIDRDPDGLAAAKDAIDGSVATFVCDLQNEVARVKAVQDILDHRGVVDILINNAAFVGDSSLDGWAVPFEEQNLDAWRAALEVNLTAPFHLTQLLASALRASRNASVINLGSIYGILGPDWSLYENTPMANPAAYGASKGGLIQLTRWLATTLGPAIRVNAISPGGIARAQPESFVEQYVEKTPMGRMGTETDFVGAVAFLASDASSWITGQNIVIDGGFSAW